MKEKLFSSEEILPGSEKEGEGKVVVDKSHLNMRGYSWCIFLNVNLKNEE